MGLRIFDPADDELCLGVGEVDSFEMFFGDELVIDEKINPVVAVNGDGDVGPLADFQLAAFALNGAVGLVVTIGCFESDRAIRVHVEEPTVTPAVAAAAEEAGFLYGVGLDPSGDGEGLLVHLPVQGGRQLQAGSTTVELDCVSSDLRGDDFCRLGVDDVGEGGIWIIEVDESGSLRKADIFLPRSAGICINFVTEFTHASGHFNDPACVRFGEVILLLNIVGEIEEHSGPVLLDEEFPVGLTEALEAAVAIVVEHFRARRFRVGFGKKVGGVESVDLAVTRQF